MLHWRATVTAMLVCLCACGPAEVLVSKPAVVPVGLDLSGNWVLTETTGTSQRDARDLLVHVFLETGNSVKVTQTGSGLFVSFDRSVVEEYRFGENREVSVGPISAQRVSGWEGTAYVIETLDDDGAKLIDSYRLQDQGQVLRRTILILHRNRRMVDLELEYRRS